MAKFEDNLTALEGVVERLERGDLPLEDSVKLFEEGMKLSAACKAELETAEGKIQVLVEQGSGKMLATEVEAKEDGYAAADDDRDEEDE